MAISGHTGTVSLGTGGALCATSWDMTLTTERLDSTSSCYEEGEAGWRTFVRGLKGASGNVNADVFRAVDPTAKVAISLANDDVTLAGNGLVNYSGESPIDGKVTHTYEFVFCGEVTVTPVVA